MQSNTWDWIFPQLWPQFPPSPNIVLWTWLGFILHVLVFCPSTGPRNLFLFSQKDLYQDTGYAIARKYEAFWKDVMSSPLTHECINRTWPVEISIQILSCSHDVGLEFSMCVPKIMSCLKSAGTCSCIQHLWPNCTKLKFVLFCFVCFVGHLQHFARTTFCKNTCWILVLRCLGRCCPFLHEMMI